LWKGVEQKDLAESETGVSVKLKGFASKKIKNFIYAPPHPHFQQECLKKFICNAAIDISLKTNTPLTF